MRRIIPNREQTIPLSLTLVVCGVLVALIFVEIKILNLFVEPTIRTQVHLSDVLVGMTIYLKTAIDFAIFIGNLMSVYPGWKNRVMIEIGTAFGNALGTVIIIVIWNFFRNIEILLAAMIVVASLVLLKLAEEGLSHAREGAPLPKSLESFGAKLYYILHPVNQKTHLVLRYLLPNLTMTPKGSMTFWGLFGLSFSVPFILGLDDFAGYIPLFNIVNVFGFAIGVLLGHMILNIFLFISPTKTIQAVKNPIIAVFGAVAFVGIAVWGLWEVMAMLFLHH